jgi:hypothetical protein
MIINMKYLDRINRINGIIKLKKTEIKIIL